MYMCNDTEHTLYKWGVEPRTGSPCNHACDSFSIAGDHAHPAGLPSKSDEFRGPVKSLDRLIRFS